MRRSDLGYALLFSVPVGVGVALAVYQTTGDFPGNPLALGGGLLALVTVFALVVLGVRPGPDAPAPDARALGPSRPDAPESGASRSDAREPGDGAAGDDE